MKNNSSKQDVAYSRLYNDSQKYAPYKWLSRFGIRTVTQATGTHFLISYGFAVIASIWILSISYLYRFYPDKTPFYLSYLVFVALSAWLGGRGAGMLTLVLTTLGAGFLFGYLTHTSSFLHFDIVFQLFVFVVSSGSIVFLIDRTLHTPHLKELKRQQARYAQAFVQLYEAYIKAHGEIKARDEFLSIASHELKTPLTSMLLKLHHILNSVRTVSLAHFSVQELMKVLENAEQQIQSLTARINDLLNLSLITTGRMDLKPKKTDLVAVTKHVEENFSELLKRDGGKLTITADSPVVGYWDKTRIEQVITNLFSNALKYGQGKPIDIRVFKSGSMGMFIIQDYGIGIAHKEQKNIFDRFQRTKESEKYHNGFGVGLYITYQIVKAHGGTVTLSSAPLKGSAFTVELPLFKS